MRQFNYNKLKEYKFDAEIVNYLTSIHELRFSQTQHLSANPLKFNRLIETAKIRSTEASNAIEGIRTSSTRLKQITSSNAEPRNRSEEEIAGYRDVLNLINENYEYIDITPNYILQLHQLLLKYTATDIGGKFKCCQNYIKEIDAYNNERIIFTPLAPFETADAIQQICEQYNIAIAEKQINPLIIIFTFIHDFLCIHPFHDGNGRMSRLLTALLLYKSGYMIGKYISLEDKISKSKDLYYLTLEQAQHGWHSGKEDCTPFIKYMLGIIIAAYRDFDERTYILKTAVSSANIVSNAIRNMIGKFTKSDIAEQCPTLSTRTIEINLKLFKLAKYITQHEQGKNTYYTRNDHTEKS